MKKNLGTLLTLTVIACLTGVALASSTQPPAAPGINFGAFTPLALLLISALGTGLTWLVTQGGVYFGQKTQGVTQAMLREALVLVTELVFRKVAELNEAAITKLKAAASDGKLTGEEAKAALATAVAEVWASIPAAIQALLLKHYGSFDALRDKLIIPRIEEAVTKMRHAVQLTTSVYAVGSAKQPASVYTEARPTVGPRAHAEARARLGLTIPMN